MERLLEEEGRRSHPTERSRLRRKLATGHVSSVWLQLGSDVAQLDDALAFLGELKRGRELPQLRLDDGTLLPQTRDIALRAATRAASRRGASVVVVVA